MLLHGFTQTGRLWGPFGDMLARDHTLIAVDLPGHAGSDGVRADLPTTAELVRDAVAASIGGGAVSICSGTPSGRGWRSTWPPGPTWRSAAWC